MAIAHLIVVVLGFYGLKYRNRVTLMGHLVIQTWILQASFRYFYRTLCARVCRVWVWVSSLPPLVLPPL